LKKQKQTVYASRLMYFLSIPLGE